MGFVIKLQFETDVRRLTLEKLPAFAELLDLVRSLFESSNLPSSFLLKYKDDEGDLISVGSDRELTEAFNVMGKGILRFTVVPVASKPTPSPSSSSNPNERVVEIDVGPYLDQIVDLIGQFTGRRPNVPSWAGCGNGNEAVHFGVTCDGCNAHPIRGNRHKCTECPNYDLCDKCLAQGIHKEHSFNKITQPSRPWCHRWNNQAGNSNEAVHFGVQCDGCGVNPIRGIRYKCAVCSDYDLCSQCLGRGIHKEHAEQFTKIEHPRRCHRNWGCGRRQQEQAPAPAAKESKEEVKAPETVQTPAVIPLIPKQPESPKPETNPSKEEVKAPESPKVEVKPETIPLIPLAQPRPSAPVIEPEQPYAAQNKQLVEMGFVDQARNLTLLNQYKGDMVKAVMHLFSN